MGDEVEKIIKGKSYLRRQYAKKDITGKAFGRLMAIRYSHYEENNQASIWLCVCECGKETLVRLGALTSGRIKGCGCACPPRKDYKKQHPIYHLWQMAKDRCINKNNKRYHRYGGRGIKVCKEWVDNYDAFYDHCIGLYIPGRKMDRIDNDKDYEQGNMRWATPVVSTRNSTSTKLNKEKVRTIRRSMLTHKELAKEYKVATGTIAALRCKNSITWVGIW